MRPRRGSTSPECPSSSALSYAVHYPRKRQTEQGLGREARQRCSRFLCALPRTQIRLDPLQTRLPAVHACTHAMSVQAGTHDGREHRLSHGTPATHDGHEHLPYLLSSSDNYHLCPDTSKGSASKGATEDVWATRGISASSRAPSVINSPSATLSANDSPLPRSLSIAPLPFIRRHVKCPCASDRHETCFDTESLSVSKPQQCRLSCGRNVNISQTDHVGVLERMHRSLFLRNDAASHMYVGNHAQLNLYHTPLLRANSLGTTSARAL